MAAVLKEQERARLLYDALQARSCPLVEGLYLQDAHSMLQLLCEPSQHRTDILAWICNSINPDLTTSKSTSKRIKDSEILNKEMALFGQELMLCKANDLDLIRGEASPSRQLHFLEDLLSLVADSRKSAGHRVDGELLLNEIFTNENLPHLAQMLEPTLNPWPAHMKALHKPTISTRKPGGEEADDLAARLQDAQSALEQLRSECEFLKEPQNPAVFSPNSLRVVACDLQQLMSTFSHVYDTDLRTYIGREPPTLRKETDVFQRVHQLLLNCNTELEMLKEVSEASTSVTEEVNRLQTQPRYWRKGEKHTLPVQLAELTRRSKEFLSLMAANSNPQSECRTTEKSEGSP